jgi:serine/threonine protein kinase
MGSRQVIARFEAERQALALMDHPNIARVLDAGTIGEPGALSTGGSPVANAPGSPGRPYFVMELVKGVPITKYCDEHQLTPRQRLELFVPVCQAVQHAHQKGIIHRDLKPSNVLVCLYDGKPVPKVIDFGIAKAAGPSLTEKTLFTELGQVVGTLEYMSPEQAELNQLDIDTRSDIYSLGRQQPDPDRRQHPGRQPERHHHPGGLGRGQQRRRPTGTGHRYPAGLCRPDQPGRLDLHVDGQPDGWHIQALCSGRGQLRSLRGSVRHHPPGAMTG